MIEPRECFHFTNEGEWVVPRDLPYFEGHFPGRPILPAVAVLDGSLELIRQRNGADETPELLSLKSSKFMEPITPGMRVKIEAHEFEAKKWRIEWRSEADGSTRALAQLSLVVR